MRVCGKGEIIVWKYLIPVIIGVVIALFSDEIDKLLNGNKELKKVILVFSGGLIIICMIAAVISVL